jgi:hypothetical protein
MPDYEDSEQSQRTLNQNLTKDSTPSTINPLKNIPDRKNHKFYEQFVTPANTETKNGKSTLKLLAQGEKECRLGMEQKT